MRSRQPLCKPLPNRTQAIISFISRSPERVSANIFWCFDDFQDGVVGGDALECDVPLTASINFRIEELFIGTQHASFARKSFCTAAQKSALVKLPVLLWSLSVSSPGNQKNSSCGVETYVRRNDRNFIIKFSILIYGDASLAVAQCVSVRLSQSFQLAHALLIPHFLCCGNTYFAGLRLPSQLAQLLPQDVLILNPDVLVSEEHHSTLRECSIYQPFSAIQLPSILSFRPLLRRNFKHTRDSKISNFSIIIEDVTELKLWELAADDGSYVEGLVVIQCARVFERGWEGGALSEAGYQILLDFWDDLVGFRSNGWSILGRVDVC
jgi:hypothetical protein